MASTYWAILQLRQNINSIIHAKLLQSYLGSQPMHIQISSRLESPICSLTEYLKCTRKNYIKVLVPIYPKQTVTQLHPGQTGYSKLTLRNTYANVNHLLILGEMLLPLCYFALHLQ